MEGVAPYMDIKVLFHIIYIIITGQLNLKLVLEFVIHIVELLLKGIVYRGRGIE